MWAAFIYFTAKGFGRALFPRYLHHRRRNMFREVFCWLRNYARYQVYNRRDRRTARALLSETAPDFFLAVLQVHDDMQLKRHGNGWTNYRLISAVIASFAAHAPAATRLVVKVHPLDRGHRDYRRKVRKMAEKHGIADRVITLESGPLAPTARKARGVITINSTSGISAIEGHTPVLVLGKSLYNIEGLVTAARTSADIDAFWSDPKPPDPELARRFLAVLRSRSLIPGSFYYPPSWERLCNEIAARIGAEEARWRPVLEHAPAGFELDLARERVALGDS
jgi:capsular polysaccharide export protein